ncbi:hypothetical protein SLA2020_279520 [Shorea laevis]
MNFFLEILQCILCCQEERYDDNDDLTSRTEKYEYFPVNTPQPNSPRSPVTLSSPFYQPNVGDSPTISYRPLQSSSKPPQSSSSLSSISYVSSPTIPKPPPGSSPTYPKPPQSSPSLAPPSSSKPLPSSPKPASSHKQSLSPPKGPSSSTGPSPFRHNGPPSSSGPPPPSISYVSSPTIPKPSPGSSPTYPKPPQSSPSLAPPSSSKLLPSSPKPASSHKQSLSPPKGPPSSSGPSPFRHNGPPSSSGPSPSSPLQTPAFKPILYSAPSGGINEERKMSYVLGKGTSPIYAIPEDIKGLIKKDMVPAVLKQPLSPSTYKHYFAALLYAEDFYLEVLMNALRYCCF